MVSVNKIHKTLRVLLNTEGRGNVARSDVDSLINTSVNELFEEMFEELTRYLNRQNRGLIGIALESVTEKTRERIQHYLEGKEITSNQNVFVLPKEIRHLDSIFNREIIGDFNIELCSTNKEFLLSKDYVYSFYPIGLITSNVLTVLPESIRKIYVSYLRNPIPCKFTYQIINEVELFDPTKTDFKDIDIHPSQEYDLLMRVALKMGINLKEKDIQEVVMRENAKEFNEEITN